MRVVFKKDVGEWGLGMRPLVLQQPRIEWETETMPGAMTDVDVHREMIRYQDALVLRGLASDELARRQEDAAAAAAAMTRAEDSVAEALKHLNRALRATA